MTHRWRVSVWLGLSMILYGCLGLALAQQSHETMPSAASSAFNTTMQNYLLKEPGRRQADMLGQGFVVSGGTHATSGSMTSAAFATVAYSNNGHYISQTSAAIDYSAAGCSADDTAWVIVMETASGALSDNFTRVSGTRYAVNCTDTVQPSLPSGGAWLMQVLIVSSALNTVTDIGQTYWSGTGVYGDNLHGSASPQAELQAWFGDVLEGYAVSGCLHGVPGSGLTTTAAACNAYVSASGGELVYVTQPSKTIGPLTNGTTNWLAIHRDTSTAVTSWTRQSGTHYLWRASASNPGNPTNGLIIASVTTSGGNITAVTDYRVPRSYMLRGVLDVTDPLYGATGDGVTNDLAAIQAAIARAPGSGTGGPARIFFPCGTYIIGTTTLEIPEYITIEGSDYTCSILSYSGAGDAIHHAPTTGVGVSGYALINIRHLQVKGTGGTSNTGAGISIVTTHAYYQLKSLRITGNFKYGVVFDGTQIASLEDSIIENGAGIANTAAVWLANSTDHGNAYSGFTNVVTLARNQFNNENWGVIIDGGNQHHILHNNFNGNKNSLLAANCTGIHLIGNSFESQLLTGSYNVRFTDQWPTSGTATNACHGGVIHGNNFSQSGTAGMNFLSFVAPAASTPHTGFHVSGNLFESKLGRNSAIDLTYAARSVFEGNTDLGTASVSHYTGL